MKFKVKALINFNDLEENKKRNIGDVFECSKIRCDYLLEHKAIEIIEEIKEEPKVEATLEYLDEPAELKATFKPNKKKKKK